MFTFGQLVRVGAADHEWFGRMGRVVSTTDPDNPTVEWCDSCYDAKRYTSIEQDKLVTYQPRFNRVKWRLVTDLRILLHFP